MAASPVVNALGVAPVAGQGWRFRAKAAVVHCLDSGSGATRMMANFFLGLKRGPIPVKMFTRRLEPSTGYEPSAELGSSHERQNVTERCTWA